MSFNRPTRLPSTIEGVDTIQLLEELARAKPDKVGAGTEPPMPAIRQSDDVQNVGRAHGLIGWLFRTRKNRNFW